MEADVVILSEVGSRLRDERRRLRLNQEDFGNFAGVTRQSQQNYESGQRPFTVTYLLALEAHGVNIVYVLTGQRSVSTMTVEQIQLLKAFDGIAGAEQAALLRVACAMTGLHLAVAPVDLPPERALIRMFEALLAGIDPKASQDEQALLLAKRLPIGLSQLRDLLPAAPTAVAASAPTEAADASPPTPHPVSTR